MKELKSRKCEKKKKKTRLSLGTDKVLSFEIGRVGGS